MDCESVRNFVTVMTITMAITSSVRARHFSSSKVERMMRVMKMMRITSSVRARNSSSERAMMVVMMMMTMMLIMLMMITITSSVRALHSCSSKVERNFAYSNFLLELLFWFPFCFFTLCVSKFLL